MHPLIINIMREKQVKVTIPIGNKSSDLPKETYSLRLDPILMAKIDELAKKYNRNRANMIETMLKQQLGFIDIMPTAIQA